MSNEPVSYEGLFCANCGTPMQGEFCHACGQSIHSVLKPMHGMLEDTLDIALHVDGRVMHTLPPLLLRPGFLTLEYFAGRRVPYVAPFRLMFVLCLLAFFLCHLAVDDGNYQWLHIERNGSSRDAGFDQQRTAADVQKHLAEQLQALEAAKRKDPDEASDLEQSERHLRHAAERRLAALQAAPAAGSSAPTPAAASSAHAKHEDDDLLNGSSKVDITWLPDFVNARLERAGQHILANLRAIRHGGAEGDEARERLVAGVFGALPQTLFVMLPVFALLLKLFYLFRRRLYMEHLIVALHSHAFLFFDLILLMLLYQLHGWVAPHAAWAATPLSTLSWLLLLWAPVYLLVMQKRIYRQGWTLTVLKYCCLGGCYFWLLLIALGVAVTLGLAH